MKTFVVDVFRAMMRHCVVYLTVLLAAVFATTVLGQTIKPYAQTVGNTPAQPIGKLDVIELPLLTWGGDVADIVANGGTNTTPDSIYGKYGLKFRLVNGDDFAQQVRNYMSGRTPYLRGTFTQIYQALDILNSDPRTKPVALFQLSWSLGDHMVGREGIKTLNDLKGKTICLQEGGPHVQLVDDALKAAGYTWKDVNIVWAPNLSGKDSPSEMFRNNPKIDISCNISPDMIGLTGGTDEKTGEFLVGTGAEGTVKGAWCFLSTRQINRSIADIEVCRTDYYKSNRSDVEKRTAGYLKGVEIIAARRREYNDGKGKSPVYTNILKMTQAFYGDKVLPTLEVDTHGLISDTGFAGLPGNISFFTDEENLNGFVARQNTTFDLLTGLGFIKNRTPVETARWDYQSLAKLASIEYVAPKVTPRIQAESLEGFSDGDNVIVSFTVYFEPNTKVFDAKTYGTHFRRVLESISTFGNCAMVVRGNADPSQTLIDFVKAGMEKGLITRTGSKAEGYRYQYKGKPIDLEATKEICALIQVDDGQAFKSGGTNPFDTMSVAQSLSKERADSVKDGIAAFAKEINAKVDLSQIRPEGVGIKDPVIAKPKNLDEAKKNMRVEFRLVRVPAEALKQSDFDY